MNEHEEQARREQGQALLAQIKAGDPDFSELLGNAIERKYGEEEREQELIRSLLHGEDSE